eukprot:Gb_15401 [translate_table: standard]
MGYEIPIISCSCFPLVYVEMRMTGMPD